MLLIRRRLWSDPIADPVKRFNALLEESVSVLDLSVRITNALEEDGVITIENLLNCTPVRLLTIPNFGIKTLMAIDAALTTVGIPMPKRSKERLARYAAEAGNTEGQKLSAAATLDRCVKDIYLVMEQAMDEYGNDCALAGMLGWVLEYAETRKTRPDARQTAA